MLKIVITKVLNEIMKVCELPKRGLSQDAKSRSLRPPKN